MTKETFNKLVDDLINTASTTLKTKNAKYAPADDALHNFHYGAQLDNSTTAQTIWHYMKKHMVALFDKINRNDWEDLDDAKEKIQDIINYLIFMWCAANESQMNTDVKPCIELCHCCPEDDIEYKCTMEDRDCGCCRYCDDDNWDDVLEMAINEPCKSCKHNFKQGSEEYKTAPDNWGAIEYCNRCYEDNISYKCTIEDKNCCSCKYFNEDLDYELSICKTCKNNYSKNSPLYESASLHWKRKE